MQHYLAFLALALLASRIFAGEPAAASPGQVLFQNVCAQCHGVKGEGNPQIKSPSIAGLPDWYAGRQLENFRQDRRGTHTQDPEGQLMRAISKVLSADQTQAVLSYVAALPRQKHEPTIKVDLSLGRELFQERCMECHRYNAEGELAFGAAPLAGLQDWYLASQLTKFKTGMRGTLKEDANGQKMVFTSTFVEDETMLKSVVAYIASLAAEADKAEVVFGK